jgi:hypothetical protein
MQNDPRWGGVAHHDSYENPTNTAIPVDAALQQDAVNSVNKRKTRDEVLAERDS